MARHALRRRRLQRKRLTETEHVFEIENMLATFEGREVENLDP